MDFDHQQRPSESSSQVLKERTVIDLEVEEDDFDRILFRQSKKQKVEKDEIYSGNYGTPMEFELPVTIPWGKALILAQMEDGVFQSKEDPDNVFIVHSYR